MVAVLAIVGLVAPATAQWVNLTTDPALFPYADGPPTVPVVLPHSGYRLAGAVGPNPLEGNEIQLYSIGGVSLVTYLKPGGGDWPGNRQSRFSIYSPAGDSWVSADGTDDTDNLDGTWTSVGLTGYNNGNGTNSPLASQGTGYVSDQGFYYGGAVYVFGGYPQWGNMMAKYDIATNSWSSLGSAGGGLYMDGGGLIGSHWYKVEDPGVLMDYDCSTDTWAADIAIAGLTDPKFGAVSGVIGNKLYIADTWEAGTPGEVYEIDPIAATVVAKKPMFMPVSQAGSVVWNGKLYVLGGRTLGGGSSAVSAIQIYDPATDTWSFGVLTMPDRRSGFLAEVIGDTLYIGNGYSGHVVGADVIDDLQKIDMNLIGSMVPEPGTMVLFGFGLLTLLGLRRRK
jgi:hypothetical protein